MVLSNLCASVLFYYGYSSIVRLTFAMGVGCSDVSVYFGLVCFHSVCVVVVFVGFFCFVGASYGCL